VRSLISLGALGDAQPLRGRGDVLTPKRTLKIYAAGSGAQRLLLRAVAAKYTCGVTAEVAMNRFGLTSVFESYAAGIVGAAVLMVAGCSDPAGGASQATGGQAATGVGGSSSLGGRASSTGGAGTGVAGPADCTASDGLICVKAEGILNGVPFACVGQGISVGADVSTGRLIASWSMPANGCMSGDPFSPLCASGSVNLVFRVPVVH